MSSSPRIVNRFLYLEHGREFPKELKIKGSVNSDSMIGYKKYTGRDAAKNKVEGKLETNQDGYLNYTRREDSRGGGNQVKTFSSMGWIKDKKTENAFREEVAKYFNEDGKLAWIPVTSFKDYVSAEQYGLFKDEDYAAIMGVVLPEFFKRVGLKEENMVWWMDFHSNKAHPHTHLTFFEKETTRTDRLFSQKQINDFKGLIWREANNREQLLNGTTVESLNKFKEKDLLSNNLRELMKQQISDRDNVILRKKLGELYRKLPEGGRLQYNSSNMIPYREDLDEIVQIILDHNDVKATYQEFMNECLKLDSVKTDALTTIYTNIQDTEDKELRVYMANQVLKGRKRPEDVDPDYRPMKSIIIQDQLVTELDNSDCYRIRIPNSPYFIEVPKEELVMNKKNQQTLKFEGDTSYSILDVDGNEQGRVEYTNLFKSFRNGDSFSGPASSDKKDFVKYQYANQQEAYQQAEAHTAPLVAAGLSKLGNSLNRVKHETEMAIDEYYDHTEFV